MGPGTGDVNVTSTGGFRLFGKWTKYWTRMTAARLGGDLNDLKMPGSFTPPFGRAISVISHLKEALDPIHGPFAHRHLV